MNTKKLKQLVLDLAIHGKLVPQDPNDEPASELLARIRAEKAATQGSASKGKKSAISSENLDEVPFVVPEGWCWTTVDALLTVISGQDFEPSKYNDQRKGIPYIIGASNIENGCLIENRWTETPTVFAKKNDLLLVCKGAVGKLAICNIEEAHIARQIQAIRDVTGLCSMQYIKTTVLIQIEHVVSQANGLIPGLKREVILNTQIPLPPLSEQRRIVAEIERWFGVIDQLESNEADLKKSIEQTKKKVLDLAIRGKLVKQEKGDEPAAGAIKAINPKAEILFESDEYGEVPEGWALVSIGDLNEYNSGGVNPLSNKDTEYELYSVPIYSSGYPEFAKGKDIGSTKQKVEKEDVLLCKINPHLNRVWIVAHYKEELQCLASSEWVVLRSSIADSQYLRYALSSEYFRMLLNNNVSGVGGSLTRAQPMFIKKYLIPVPPLEEQKRIAKRVEEVFEMVDRIEEMME